MKTVTSMELQACKLFIESAPLVVHGSSCKCLFLTSLNRLLTFSRLVWRGPERIVRSYIIIEMMPTLTLAPRLTHPSDNRSICILLQYVVPYKTKSCCYKLVMGRKNWGWELGGGVYRGSILASHPAAPSLILVDPKNSSLVGRDGT